MPRGRAYDEEFLVSEIKRVAKEFPQKKITYALLENETGIKRHIWKDGTYPKVDKTINRINNSTTLHGVITSAKTQIPNLLNDVLENKDDDKKLREVIKKHMDLENKLLEIADAAINENEELKKASSEDSEEKRHLKQQIEDLENSLARCYVQSANVVIRNEEGLKPPSEITGTLKQNSRVTDGALKDILDNF